MGKIVKMDVPRKRQPGFGLFPKAKQILVDFIAYLIALFFVLAVTSKLMHLDKFETQLAESPFYLLLRLRCICLFLLSRF